MNDIPFAISYQLAREPLPVTGEAQVAYLLLEVHSPEGKQPVRRPLNLSVVVDKSGSMRGPRMHYLKEGIGQIIDAMQPDDILSVVSYDDMVTLVIPAQPVTDKVLLKDAIALLDSGGGTMMSLGMSLGLAELHQFAGPDHVSRMLLLTDGLTRDDESQCLLLAEEAARQGVAIDTFGCGAEWDAAFLEMISIGTGGNYPIYIHSPIDIGSDFLKQVEATRASLASGVALDIKFAAGIVPRRATRVSPFIRSVDNTINENERTISLLLGDVEHDIPQTILIELMVEPKRGGTFRIAQVEARYQGMAEDDQPVRAEVVVAFSGSAAKRPKIRPLVLHYIERTTAARIIIRTLADPGGERPPLSPSVIRLFDASGRDLLEHIWAGKLLSPEEYKTLVTKVAELTQVRRTPVAHST